MEPVTLRTPGPVRYERHRPETTLLYQLVERHYPAFLTALAERDRSLPLYVEKEFEAYLKCGRLEHGSVVTDYVSPSGYAGTSHRHSSTSPARRSVPGSHVGGQVLPDRSPAGHFDPADRADVDRCGWPSHPHRQEHIPEASRRKLVSLLAQLMEQAIRATASPRPVEVDREFDPR